MVNLFKKRVISEHDHFTMSTSYGKSSAHFEHTIAITEEGVRVLTMAPVNQAEVDRLLPAAAQ